jgi:hypothetical protein
MSRDQLGGAELRFAPETPSEDPAAELYPLLRGLQDAVFRHPLAVQSLFSALVSEGREYAKTDEGQRLLEGLSHSPGLAKTRMVWEVLTLSAFVPKPEGALPGVLLEKLVRQIKVAALEPLLSRLFERRPEQP